MVRSPPPPVENRHRARSFDAGESVETLAVPLCDRPLHHCGDAAGGAYAELPQLGPSRRVHCCVTPPDPAVRLTPGPMVGGESTIVGEQCYGEKIYQR